jgi:uncharacterized cupin superfamily protein
MVSLDDLTRRLTVAQCEKAMYDVLAVVGVTTTSWKSGSVVRTMIHAVAIVLSAFSALMAAIAASGFLDLAGGAWLTLNARYVYGVTRQEATFAIGQVTLNNTGGGVYTFDPGDLIVLNPGTNKTYRNTSRVSVGSNQTGVLVDIQADEAGAASTSAPGTIVAFVTGMSGVTVTNANAVVGQDEESDPALRQRARDKTGIASPNGPADSYAFFARSAKRGDGSSIGVNRVRVVADGLGGVDVYVATATGGVTGSATDPVTALGIINADIQRGSAPLGITARVHTAVPQVIAITYQVWVYDSISLVDQQLKDAIATRLAEFMSAEPIGGNLIDEFPPGAVYHDAIRTKIGSTSAEIFHVVVTTPSSDTALTTNRVPVLGAVTGTVTKVQRRAI